MHSYRNFVYNETYDYLSDIVFNALFVIRTVIV